MKEQTIDIRNKIFIADVYKDLKRLPANCLDVIVTSPPYYALRNYDVQATKWPKCKLSIMYGFPPISIPAMTCCLGHEPDPLQYVAHLVLIFREARRVLKPTGNLWLNLGDTYVTNTMICRKGFNAPSGKILTDGLKRKDMMGIPFMVAYALRTDGWFFRQDNVWAKENAMPESVKDRTSKSHEYVFHFTKSEHYFYDADAIREQHKPQSLKRANRARSANHKNSKGAPGQPPHTFLQSKVNEGVNRARPNLNGRRTAQEALDEGQALHVVGANKRSVWAVPEELAIWKWLSSVLPPEQFKEIWQRFTIEASDKSSIWNLPTEAFPESHYAIFPQKLVEPCIVASVSHKGNCAKCGKPYKRKTERSLVPTYAAAKTLVIDDRDQNADKNDQGSNRQKAGHKPGCITSIDTIGWEKPCTCDTDEVVPPIAGDLFMGTGTTALVAATHGIDYVGWDLQEKYVEMKDRRFKKVFGLLIP